MEATAEEFGVKIINGERVIGTTVTLRSPPKGATEGSFVWVDLLPKYGFKVGKHDLTGLEVVLTPKEEAQVAQLKEYFDNGGDVMPPAMDELPWYKALLADLGIAD